MSLHCLSFSTSRPKSKDYREALELAAAMPSLSCSRILKLPNHRKEETTQRFFLSVLFLPDHKLEIENK